MSTAPGSARRLVAVTVTGVDLLRAGSDLRHVADATTEVDVLIARQDPPGPVLGTSPMDAEDYPDEDGLDVDGVQIPPVETPAVEIPAGDPAGTVPPVPHDEALPDGLRVHRLGLRWTVQDRDEPDLVAAMCELVGFDPDDRVFCVVPAIGPGGVADPEVAVLRRVVRRVARVYGLPVLQYRRVGEDAAPAAELPTRPIACGG
ncbi:hypothetical protein [Pseudonocardia sp. KRD291]|uniref:hypothetical protein n=1 Tax=Pseudonocardia sp. KRD291 TaxID=2792007 RepID=UPI001C49EB39|nr:hypothetical protein [Pseudonocardia sp. KRD291]MBW0102498.1 hypothetical protein [Pseudonocardia sp. KRD291]